MMNNIERAQIFEDTLEILYKDYSEQTAVSTDNTKVFHENQVLNDGTKTFDDTEITVTERDTISAALNCNLENTAILNFASGTQPGGGVEYGATAQEECICRCTNLYYCLKNSNCAKTDFYNYHINNRSNLSSDRCIYSPNVLIIKDSEYNLINNAKSVNVISCAAPNLRDYSAINDYNIMFNDSPVVDDDCLLNIHLHRAINILKTAILTNNTSIILGAFGCGAFRNNPKVVANAYNIVLNDFGYKKYFKRIEFAVYCPSDDKSNFNAFNETIRR